MARFLITKAGVVTSFRKRASSDAALESAPKGSVVITKSAELLEAPKTLSVAIHNAMAETVEDMDPIKGIKGDREKENRRIFGYLKKLATEGEEVEGSARGGQGRKSALSGCKLYKTVEGNPRRGETSHGYRAWELLKDGMTFEKYKEAVLKAEIPGGTKHIIHDFNMKRIRAEQP